MQSAAGQCLVQLTTADSVFLSKTDAGNRACVSREDMT